MISSLRFLPLCLALALVGCVSTFHHSPYPMYDGTLPHSQTAVFSAFDDKATWTNSFTIQSVNGKKTSCSEAGCPSWVRVAPGTHTFMVSYRSNFSWSPLNGPSHNQATLTIEAKDMMPRHVYVTRIREANSQLRVVVEDLGETPDYGLILYEGVTKSERKVYRPNF